MKLWKVIGCFCTILCATTAWSQRYENGVETNNQVVKYTLMERFEPELTLTSKQRERMKKERFVEIDHKLRILDTMDISERKREKLMEALIEDPFSPRLHKVFAEIDFEAENR